LTGPNPVKEDLICGLLVQAGVEDTLRDAKKQIYYQRARKGAEPPTEPKMYTYAEQPDRREAGGASWGGSWSSLGEPKPPTAPKMYTYAEHLRKEAGNTSNLGKPKPKGLTEPQMLAFAEVIAAPLKVQLEVAGDMSGQGEHGSEPPRIGLRLWLD
jgi:hypothetical protein